MGFGLGGLSILKRSFQSAAVGGTDTEEVNDSSDEERGDDEEEEIPQHSIEMDGLVYNLERLEDSSRALYKDNMTLSFLVTSTIANK